MKTTLNWLFYESGLKNIRCMACSDMGDSRFDRVNNIDNPNTVRWIKQDELIITTGYLFADDEKKQIQLIDELKEVGCAGLGIKIKSFFEEIPECMIKEAEKVRLPLFEIPYYYSLSDISQVIYNHIYELNHLDKQREQRLIEDISEMFFTKHAVLEIVLKISEYLRKTVLLLDGSANCIYASKRKKDWELCSGGSHIEKLEVSEKNNVTALFPNGETKHGYLVSLANTEYELLVIEDETTLSVSEKKTLEHCGMIMAMSLFRSKKFHPDAYEIENENNERLYDIFCTNREIADETLFQICNEYGISTERKRILLLIQCKRGKDADASLTEVFRFMSREVEGKTWIAAGNEVSFYHGDSMFVFLQDAGNETSMSMKEKAKRLGKELKKSVEEKFQNFELTEGISRISEKKEGLRKAAHEAERAVVIGKRIQAEKEIYDFSEYVYDDYLLKHPEEKDYYLNGRLKSILDYDEENHTEYMETLTMYFTCMFNASETAKRLFIHRNTLMKRLEKMKGLLQIDFEDINQLVMLYTEICAYRLYS